MTAICFSRRSVLLRAVLDPPGASPYTRIHAVLTVLLLVGHSSLVGSIAAGDQYTFTRLEGPDKGMFLPHAIDFPGAQQTQVTGINNAGHIIGRYEDREGIHGFLAVPKGKP